MALQVLSAEDIGQRIKDVRLASGVGSRELSQRIGGHKQFVSQLEKGEKKWVNVGHLTQIANEVAGKGVLRGMGADQVFDYLTGRVDDLFGDPGGGRGTRPEDRRDAVGAPVDSGPRNKGRYLSDASRAAA